MKLTLRDLFWLVLAWLGVCVANCCVAEGPDQAKLGRFQDSVSKRSLPFASELDGAVRAFLRTSEFPDLPKDWWEQHVESKAARESVAVIIDQLTAAKGELGKDLLAPPQISFVHASLAVPHVVIKENDGMLVRDVCDLVYRSQLRDALFFKKSFQNTRELAPSKPADANDSSMCAIKLSLAFVPYRFDRSKALDIETSVKEAVENSPPQASVTVLWTVRASTGIATDKSVTKRFVGKDGGWIAMP